MDLLSSPDTAPYGVRNRFYPASKRRLKTMMKFDEIRMDDREHIDLSQEFSARIDELAASCRDDDYERQEVFLREMVHSVVRLTIGARRTPEQLGTIADAMWVSLLEMRGDE